MKHGGTHRLTPSHFSSILKLDLGNYKWLWSENSIWDELNHPNHVGAGVWIDTMFEGFFLARQAFNESWLMMIGVNVARRNQGVGRQLIGAWLDTGSERTNRFLEVHEGNQVAIKLYHSFGFKIIQKRPRYYPEPNGPAKAAFVMRYCA